MDRKAIKAGFETYGKKWGGRIWLVKDMTRKKEGRKDYFCVLGLGSGGWWRLYYGTLAQVRDYIEYETGAREWRDIRDQYTADRRAI